VYLDESGFSLRLYRPYGWSKKGQPLIEAVPERRGKNLSVLGALDAEGIVAFTHREGAMTREDIERFFEQDLLPQLMPGSVLVLDNASIHKGGRLEELAQAADCRILYLPPYSPDFNPIEMVWAFVKNLVRAEGPRDAPTRRSAVEKALTLVTPALASACFLHCLPQCQAIQ
jgi:transposase